MRFRTRPVGAILAGGGGRRIGGDKAIVELNGQPLISYPLEAVRQALGQVAILAKADTKLPYVSGVTVWIEPESRRHPLVGITQALALADGRPVVVCGADLPFVTADARAAAGEGQSRAGTGGGGVRAGRDAAAPRVLPAPGARIAQTSVRRTPAAPLRDCDRGARTGPARGRRSRRAVRRRYARRPAPGRRDDGPAAAPPY